VFTLIKFLHIGATTMGTGWGGTGPHFLRDQEQLAIAAKFPDIRHYKNSVKH